MFSTRFQAALDKVSKYSRSAVFRAMDRVIDLPDIPPLFWSPELGRGGSLDRSILQQAAEARSATWNGRIFPIVPVYVTSICNEGCLYCNYRAGNRADGIERLRLSDEELRREVEFLVTEKGLRSIELVYASDPRMGAEAICRHVGLVRETLERLGGGTVGLSAQALEESDYRRLVEAGLDYSVLWQETYDRDRYAELHPGRMRKTDFDYRLDAFDRMLSAGLRHVGMGVLSGLGDWRRDWAMLIEHAVYLRSQYGGGAAILGIPRLKPAPGALVHDTPWIPTRQEFLVTVALCKLAAPRWLPVVSTREDWDLCLELAAGGGCLFTFNCSTIPGGYSRERHGYQFQSGSYDATVFRGAVEKAGLRPLFEWHCEDLEIQDANPFAVSANLE